jgi:PAS domain S-box-containing protein
MVAGAVVALLATAVALALLGGSTGTWQLGTAWLLAAAAAAICTGSATTRVRREDYRLTWVCLAASSCLSVVSASLALAGVSIRWLHGSIAAAAVVLAIAAVACRFPSRAAFVSAAIEMAPVPVVLAAIPVVVATEGGADAIAWAVLLGGLSGTLVAISARLVSVRGRPWAEAFGSLLFPSAMATLAVAGLAAPLQLLERADLSRTLGQVASLAGFALLCGAALRRMFARSRPPRFAAPPLNGLATFSASTLAVLAIWVAALASRWQGHPAVSDLLGIFALVALGAYVGRGFILRSAVHRLVHRLESATETLRKEQGFSSAVLDAAGSLINVLDHEGRMIRWNRACEEMAGRSEAELNEPGTWVSVLPEDEASTVLERIGRILDGELRNTGENHWIRPDGERRLISWTNTALLDRHGSVEFSVGVGVDVTDRRQAERELRRTTSTLRGLVDASPLSIVATDRDDVVQVWSPAAARLTAWPADEAIGRRLVELIVPDGRRAEYAEARAGLLSGATISSLETVRRRRDGAIVDVEVSASPLRDADGTIMGIVWVETDVSVRRQAAEALRQSEERFRGYFEHAPTGMTITSIDGAIVGVNPAFCRMVGYTETELVGTPFQAITHPDDVAANVVARERLLRGEEARLAYEKRYVHRDGHTVWAHLSIEMLPGGTDRKLLAHVQDVTERKRSELEREELLQLKQQMLAELEAQNDRLRELDRLKDEFLALVSHELRTPLTSIKGYLSVMGDEDVAGNHPERARYLEIVDRNARRLEQLVEDLLLIAQIDAGKLELDRLEVDLAGIVADAVETAAGLARARDIEVTLERAGPSPLLGDATRLGQVVDNLLANALKFTPDGGAVRVRVGSNGSETYVEIEDTGIGIPTEEQAQLFQRFFRATNARQRAIKGTGLGLAICRAIVEAHRGFITLRSEPQAGTTVAVRFPVEWQADTGRSQAA